MARDQGKKRNPIVQKAFFVNDNTLIAISGYAGDQSQIENNLPVYRHHGCPILVLSPSDAPITTLKDDTGIQFQSAGDRGWAGPHTLKRQEEFLKILLGTPYEWFLFHDSDSICLSPKIPEYLFGNTGILWSNEVPDPNTMPSRLPKIALQPPYFFHRTVLVSLIQHAATPAISFGKQTNGIDHWMLRVMHSTGLPHRSFPDGASFETTSDHGFSVMREHVGRHGKIFIHQVKHKHVLDQLTLDRRYFLENRIR